MNSKPILPTARAFSLIDLLILVGTVVLVVVLLLPMLGKARVRGGPINCVNNLKQVGLSFRLWAGDHGDKYPMQVSTNQGGAMEWVSAGAVAPQFAVMSNELATPRILLCPDDKRRAWATNFSTLTAGNVSYFVVLEADEIMPSLWLSGDRHLATNGVNVRARQLVVGSNSVLGWSQAAHNGNGNITLGDGSVQHTTVAIMSESFTNALRDYNERTSNTTFRILLP
jgi:prepilin-type processing-associated H-X9-DG protein